VIRKKEHIMNFNRKTLAATVVLAAAGISGTLAPR
jgi:hypothetical protein